MHHMCKWIINTAPYNGHGQCVCVIMYVWQSQVDIEHYSTLSGLVISLGCFIEITPDFQCPGRPLMKD